MQQPPLLFCLLPLSSISLSPSPFLLDITSSPGAIFKKRREREPLFCSCLLNYYYYVFLINDRSQTQTNERGHRHTGAPIDTNRQCRNANDPNESKLHLFTLGWSQQQLLQFLFEYHIPMRCVTTKCDGDVERRRVWRRWAKARWTAAKENQKPATKNRTSQWKWEKA